MKIKTATVEIVGDHQALKLDTDEGELWIDATALKPRTLAICAPLTGQGVDEGTAGTAPILIRAAGPRESDYEIAHATQDTVVVELARQWAAGELGDPVGPVPIPTFAAADASQWELRGENLIRRA